MEEEIKEFEIGKDYALDDLAYYGSPCYVSHEGTKYLLTETEDIGNGCEANGFCLVSFKDFIVRNFKFDTGIQIWEEATYLGKAEEEGLNE